MMDQDPRVLFMYKILAVCESWEKNHLSNDEAVGMIVDLVEKVYAPVTH